MSLSRDAKVKGGWLPPAKAHKAWFRGLAKRAETRQSELRAVKEKLSPEEATDAEPVFQHDVVREFKALIESDPIIRMYMVKMIDQVPGYYKENPGDGQYLESIDQMLMMIDTVLGETPLFSDSGLVGFPINAILDWSMGVPAGFALYRLDKINEMYKRILDVYTDFLGSTASLDSLTEQYKEHSEQSWMSPAAQEKLNMKQYQDPVSEDQPLYGYDCWNHFFYREFNHIDKQRPIEEPENKSVIVSPCDSTVVTIQRNVRKKDWFWVKSQPYSLQDMLAPDPALPPGNDKAHDELVDQFVGGDVYQAFLAATKYHRWNSPVDGVIKAAYVIPGTYYSEAESETMDASGPDLSQGYIAHVATRALFVVQADEPVGLICFLAIGMAEVSSCVINPDILQTIADKGECPIKKRDSLGYFQHGGSSSCLVFKKGVIKEFNAAVNDDVWVARKIATAFDG